MAVSVWRWDFRCAKCGQFMRLDGTELTYTPFGDSTMLEPPDDRYIHRLCWDKMPPEYQRLTARIAWQACSEIRALVPPIGSKS